MGNAALLHRYGFTELDNPYDIVNIDLTLVTKWCSSKYSHRYAKARVSLWHKLGYSGCTSEDAEYFEIDLLWRCLNVLENLRNQCCCF